VCDGFTFFSRQAPAPTTNNRERSRNIDPQVTSGASILRRVKKVRKLRSPAFSLYLSTAIFFSWLFNLSKTFSILTDGSRMFPEKSWGFNGVKKKKKKNGVG